MQRAQTLLVVLLGWVGHLIQNVFVVYTAHVVAEHGLLEHFELILLELAHLGHLHQVGTLLNVDLARAVIWMVCFWWWWGWCSNSFWLRGWYRY